MDLSTFALPTALTVTVAPTVGTGTEMFPAVPLGALTCRENAPDVGDWAQRTAIVPNGVGTLPSAHVSEPGCGWTSHAR